MATYSAYNNDIYTVGSNVYLLNPQTQSYTFIENKVVEDLLDNTGKLIQPISLRNSILSLYDSIPFKETTASGSNIYYIGIDKNDQNLKQPIYIGKRYNDGTEIIDSSLLGSSDIIINGTDLDKSVNNISTKMRFLSGTNRVLYTYAPHIESREVSNNNNTTRLDLGIINNSGNISILSRGPNVKDPGSNIIINNIKYPSVQESDPTSQIIGSASDGRVLSYLNGTMVWSDTIPNDPGYYGVTGSTTSLFGSETYINGYSLEFSDDRYSPIEIGNVSLGEKFNKVSLRDILEKIIYDYLPPVCTLELSNPNMKYVEVGTSPDISLIYSATKRTLDTNQIALTNMSPNKLSGLNSDYTSVSGSAIGKPITPLEIGSNIFQISINDNINTISASVSVSAIYPIFYGINTSTIVNNILLSDLSSIIIDKTNQNIDFYKLGITNSDKIYFVYDYDYGLLSNIYDPVGVDIINSFVIEDHYLSSPSGNWAAKRFRVYRFDNLYSYVGQNTVSTLFKFVF
jgi:hypothetical protein